MKIIDHIYVNGTFVKPHGSELFEIRNPATAQVIGRLTLGDQEDTRHAIAAAKEAFATFSQTGKEERITLLKRLHDTVLARADDLREATIEEYGAPLSRATWIFMLGQSATNRLPTLSKASPIGFNPEAKVVCTPPGVNS